MSRPAPSVVCFLFAVAVVISGCVRYFTREGGEKGLWFGLVMGALSLLAAQAYRGGRAAAGRAVGGFAALVVAGWFAYESFVIKGWPEAEPRQLIILVLALITLLALLPPPSAAKSA